MFARVLIWRLQEADLMAKKTIKKRDKKKEIDKKELTKLISKGKKTRIFNL